MYRLALLLTAVMLTCVSGCSRAQTVPMESSISGWKPVTPPPSLMRYTTEAFNLLSRDPSIITGMVQFDAEFYSAWKGIMKGVSLTPDVLEKRLLSGPQKEGRYWGNSTRSIFVYTACQAHSCSTTNIVLYYDPKAHSMGGRLQDRCGISWVGPMDEDLKNLLERISPIDPNDSNRKLDCK
ncbi:hypothetical protein [Stenotrophomonas sp. MMGLT7]|uniref:hypothetical protein n=1 Tax=Stenotrophomonas sp. MMGLT7 TaxID=2901227 RepID=UPI001E4AE3D2|nr:hypothetical protein [Stenotrophomonas sp. MMGLT7]